MFLHVTTPKSNVYHNVEIQCDPQSSLSAALAYKAHQPLHIRKKNPRIIWHNALSVAAATGVSQWGQKQ